MSLYQKRYGEWAGFSGHQPDLTCCCVEVASTHFHQCHRKCGYGPEKAYCKIHDPDAVAARQREAENRNPDRSFKPKDEPS